MSPTLKKILLIIGFSIVVALIGAGLYLIFVKKPTTLPPGTTGTAGPGTTGQLPAAGERPTTLTTPGAGEIPGTLPTAATIPGEVPGFFQAEPVKQLTPELALFTSLNNQGTVRYQNPSDGKFYQITGDGSIRALSDQAFYDVSKVTWAKNKNQAVLEYPDNSKIIYNFESQKQVTLPKHWQEFSFAPEGSEIAAKSIALSPENRWLVTVKDDGTGTQLIEPLGNNAAKVTVDWSPSRQTVALSQTGEPLGADRREVLFVGLHGENFKSTVVEGTNLVSQWSPTGQRLLYSVVSQRNSFKPELWVVDAYGDQIGGSRQALQVNTWADKCAFGGENTLYCAIPQELPNGAGMAREISDGTPDDVYKIDLTTGLKTPLSLGNNSYHVGTISYDKTRNKVIFTDPNQAGIFEINP